MKAILVKEWTGLAVGVIYIWGQKKKEKLKVISKVFLSCVMRCTRDSDLSPQTILKPNYAQPASQAPKFWFSAG